MDWYLDGESAASVAELRREFVAYLRRHGDPSSDFDEAELVFGEAVGNAVRHAPGPVWVSASWSGEHPVLSVYDLGPGVDPDLVARAAQRSSQPIDLEGLDLDGPELYELPESGLGLMIIHQLAPELVARARAKGTVVSVSLPVHKAAQADHDPPRHKSGVLPALSEARPEGGFGKESFLRSLVVNLAQTLELQHGPDAADAAVAQVGTDVGGRMEEEFRLAEGIVGRMSPEEMARCYVRLKHAIDGDFHVLEATPERIVLVNTRCPFGEVVQMAPSLCRMTSSVFGGIAARNSDDGAAVVLEERIALGDPGCRVTVNLGQARADATPQAHYYAKPG